jgi:hypothetical protein
MLQKIWQELASKKLIPDDFGAISSPSYLIDLHSLMAQSDLNDCPRDESGKPLFCDFTAQKSFVFNVVIRKKRPFRMSL